MPKPRSRWPDTTVLNQRSVGTGTTDSEMFITDAIDEDSDSDAASTAATYRMQRGSGDSEKRLDGVAPFIERNPDNFATTLEWRGSSDHKWPPKLRVPAGSIRPRSAGVRYWRPKLSEYENTIMSRRRFWRGRSRSSSRVTSGRSRSWKRRRKMRRIIPSLNGGRFIRNTSPRSAEMGVDTSYLSASSSKVTAGSDSLCNAVTCTAINAPSLIE